jgi:hypothetical protein
VYLSSRDDSGRIRTCRELRRPARVDLTRKPTSEKKAYRKQVLRNTAASSRFIVQVHAGPSYALARSATHLPTTADWLAGYRMSPAISTSSSPAHKSESTAPPPVHRPRLPALCSAPRPALPRRRVLHRHRANVVIDPMVPTSIPGHRIGRYTLLLVCQALVEDFHRRCSDEGRAVPFRIRQSPIRRSKVLAVGG